jgi:hypothetical protein
MDKCINYREFEGYLFDDERLIQKGTEIMHALLARLTTIRITH